MKYAIAILMLLIIMMGCQPATSSAPSVQPVTPSTSPTSLPPPAVPAKIVEKATTFDSMKYTNPTYQFSVAYPAGWTPTPTTLMGGAFYAKGPGNDRIYIAVRPATNFRETAIACMNDLITAEGYHVVPIIDSETAITLADGTKADVILLSVGFGQAKVAITGALKDGNAIMIFGASDPKNMELYKEIGSTLIVQTTTPNASTAQPVDYKIVEPKSKILFLRGYEWREIYVMNEDGTNIMNLTNNSIDDAWPDWSPDKSKIIFERPTNLGNTALYSMNSDGSNVTQITNTPSFCQFPVWSPDGTKIAFCKSRVASGGTNIVRHNIWIMNPDGSDMKQITFTSAQDTDIFPRWFPDSKRIAFLSMDAGLFYICSVDINTLSKESFGVPIGSQRIDVSPDGNKILYVHREISVISNTGYVQGEISVINLNTGEVAQLTKPTFPAAYPYWSPDGKQIVFQGFIGGCGLYKMNADGTNQTKIPNNSSCSTFDTPASWR
jgi:Tol biopolymer transport system component